MSEILVVRSARDNVLAYACRQLRWRHPGVALAVLCQPEHSQQVSSLVQPDRVFSYPEKNFTDRGLPDSLRRELQQQNFSEVVVLYNNVSGESYAAVHKMIRSFHHGPVGIINSDGRYSRRVNLAADAVLAGAGIVAAAAFGALAALFTSLIAKDNSHA